MFNEIDQGQICLNCNTGCVGFKSHPWRYTWLLLKSSFNNKNNNNNFK